MTFSPQKMPPGSSVKLTDSLQYQQQHPQHPHHPQPQSQPQPQPQPQHQPPQSQSQTTSHPYQQHQYASQPQQVQVPVHAQAQGQVRPSQYQQPQHHHQQLAMNGINGNMAAAPPPMPAAPTPAGHQAELNYIYGMVEELSRQLADNRRVTEDIVNGLGRVRSRAKSQNLSNDELIAAAAPHLQGEEETRQSKATRSKTQIKTTQLTARSCAADSRNLDTVVSILSESLEKANFGRDANAALLTQYANALALMLKQLHDYKAKHVADVAAWHRSYRVQLDEARQENSRLREQIWEMQTHASRANENLRLFRSKYDEDAKRWEKRVEGTRMRQELRFWKRMAMPELDDDDSYWSGDDDVIDEAEKERLRELEQRAAQEQLMEGHIDEDAGDAGDAHHMGVMGGIAMQRDESARAMALPLPLPPPRPLSAASSTGSTGQ
ncbi:uncharacterized protein MAM_06925 [Metarhizium album ARSEF 1941]|uniref:Uncharacterized protein n=1 Tax=Metarhizium album (strain ARSEF 1941) TaxID=1081103 RepID=A0A0B2WNI8_METAS|nr:uncharacterized protein MAM_06925 [Metarhizium album ARSEF 1941]KHN95214.1 hypothetical protein MAM_06925 [Metarhizium album ARSEF 1941]